MIDVTTGPEDEPEREAELLMTDYDWVTGALAYALIEDIKLEELEFVLSEAKTGEEFDSAVVATIWLKDIVEGNYESF